MQETGKKIKVLFISAWYPHRYDLMSGLFVRKHAEAVSLYCDVTVLYVHADEQIDKIEIVEQQHNNLHEVIVYYPVNIKHVFYKILKIIRYVTAYRKGYKRVIQNGFLPGIVQVNILTRTGVMAYLHKLWKGIPYTIIEHWTRYLPSHPEYKGYIRKKLTERVVKHASAVMPVSEILKKEMISHGLRNPDYTVVSNVVDDFFFQEMEKKKREIKRFLHISCFIETAKNVSGILRATKLLSEERHDFELVIIGTGPDFEKIIALSESLNFPKDMVTFTGEKTPHEVAWWFQNSDAFVLFSNYETAGVVVAESLASGVPVIATPTGIIPEVIDEATGLIVDFRDEQALKEKMSRMLDHIPCGYDPERIREKARKFSYAVVGKELETIYTQVLEN